MSFGFFFFLFMPRPAVFPTSAESNPHSPWEPLGHTYCCSCSFVMEGRSYSSHFLPVSYQPCLCPWRGQTISPMGKWYLHMCSGIFSPSTIFSFFLASSLLPVFCAKVGYFIVNPAQTQHLLRAPQPICWLSYFSVVGCRPVVGPLLTHFYCQPTRDVSSILSPYIWPRLEFST